MLKTFAISLVAKLIKAVFQAYRLGKLNRDGQIEKSEIATVARCFIDLILDELEEVQDSRHGVVSQMLSDMRFRIGQVESNMRGVK
jgi:hypothetical protein